MVDADTVLVSVALVATSINTLLTTFTLLHSVNEKAKLIKTIHAVTKALVVVAKKAPIRSRLRTAGSAGKADLREAKRRLAVRDVTRRLNEKNLSDSGR
ncbi:MAG: hypothetical protein ABSF00_03535 [Candidatus Bathyarchaeia archaeon]|jgi:hypothetical protein